MSLIKIDYKPRTWARAFHETSERWRVLVLHRRAGKTVASVNQLIKDAMLTNFSRFAYICPTYRQAKMIVWDMIKHYSRPIPGMGYHESELRADFPNGSRISLYGAENVDSLRGIALWGVVFDEYAQQPRKIFTEVVSKCLADHLGYAIWIGTPMGKNDFYNLHIKAQENDEWFHHAQGIDKTLAEEDGDVVDNLRQALEDDKKLVEQGIMEQDEFDQEWNISFEASIKGAYYGTQIARLREDGRLTKVPYDENLPVQTWWDLGVGDATAILFFQQYRDEWRMIDAYEASGESLHAFVKVLQDKGYLYSMHHFPHDAKVRELSTGKTRLEIAKRLGIRPTRLVPKLPIDDGINAVRMNFPKLWIDEEKCSEFIDKLSQYRKSYDSKGDTYKTRPVHDHTSNYADALRYWAVSQRGVASIGKDKILRFGQEEFDPFSVL